MTKQKKWRIPEVCPSEELLAFTKNELLAKLLTNRNVSTPEQAKEFLSPLGAQLLSPDVFNDMEKAVSRIVKAVAQTEHILIWGDFDADGVTSTALLYKVLTKLGANFSHFIPEREAHGHGLNSKALLGLVSKQKVKVVITVDCGISDTKQVALLKGLGVDTIITDHHKAPEELPEAYAIINPRAKDALSSELSVSQITSLCDLAGVGVAHKLATALLTEFKIIEKALENELLALVAIGTISDIVPLLGENRTLVAKGLKCINNSALLGVSELFKTASKQGEITSTDIAFILTPRINAVGRLSKADEAFTLLTSKSPGQLSISIEHLTNNNKIRQSLGGDIFQEALAQISKDPSIKNQRAVVLFNSGWHLGIIGIVASKLVDVFNKPVFLATLDSEGIARSSARGVNGYNIYEIMKENESLFLGYGGHALAGGLSFDPKLHSFDEVKSALLKTFDEQPAVEVGNVLEIDAALNAEDINKDLLKTLSKLEPYGQCNPSPVFCLKDARLNAHSFMGKEGSHLKYFCEKEGRELTCVWWGKGKGSFNIPEGTPLSVAFSPRLNVFNGNETIQLETCDIECDLLNEQEEAQVQDAPSIKFYDHRHKTDILPQINEYLVNPQIDLRVIALKSTTIAALKPFSSISERVGLQGKTDALMFFDYPATKEELEYMLLKSEATKIHLMSEAYEEDIESYIKKLSGMLKFISNKREGQLEPAKIVQELSLSENFVALALSIFEEMGSIKFSAKNKVAYIKPIIIEELIQSPHYEKLIDEFDKTMEFKSAILYSDEYESLFNLDRPRSVSN